MSVSIAGEDGECRADVGLGGGVSRAGGAGDIDAAALPLITDRAEAVDIGERIRRGQRLTLRRRGVVDGHAAGRRVVDVG
ncbi:MAG TPA: hypothetical protein PLX65_00735, partial [Accumulibacter sp.]|nr:hypothetical protein [Accumulibacter sp.]